MMFSSNRAKIVLQFFFNIFHPRLGGYGLMVLLNEPWDFARVNLYGSLFVSDVTLSIFSKHSSKD